MTVQETCIYNTQNYYILNKAGGKMDRKRRILHFLELKDHSKKYYHILLFSHSKKTYNEFYGMKIILSKGKSPFYQNVLTGFLYFLGLPEEYKDVVVNNYNYLFGDIL
jgi:hypothetical protein